MYSPYPACVNRVKFVSTCLVWWLNRGREVGALKAAAVTRSRTVGNILVVVVVWSQTTLDLFLLDIFSVVVCCDFTLSFTFYFLVCLFLILVGSSKFMWRSLEDVKPLNAINHPHSKKKLTVKKLNIKML